MLVTTATNPDIKPYRYSDVEQYIEVDLGNNERIAGIVTQGRQDAPQWVESFNVETSLDGVHWYMYVDKFINRDATMFPANFDQNTPVRSMFDREIDARYVRIYPKTWHELIALRFEILSCYGPAALQTTAKPQLVSGLTPTGHPQGYSTATPTAKPPKGDDGSPTKAPCTLECLVLF